MAKKKITLETLAEQLTRMDARMEAGFAAVAEDIGDIREKMATKNQLVALHTQVNAIETELRGMKHVKLQSRVADLEEKVFGASRV